MNKADILPTLTGKKELVYSGFRIHAEKAVQFWIGEWLLYGENHYGKVRYEQAIEETGLDIQTLYNYKWVASKVPISLRRNNLSFHHHKEVAGLTPELQ